MCFDVLQYSTTRWCYSDCSVTINDNLRLGKLTKTALLTFHFIWVQFTQKWYMQAQVVIVMLS